MPRRAAVYYGIPRRLFRNCFLTTPRYSLEYSEDFSCLSRNSGQLSPDMVNPFA